MTIPQEALFDWLEAEVSAISCWSRGDPSYEHSAYHMREQVMKVLADARKAFAQQAAQQPSDFDAWQANPYTKVLQKSIAEDYVPKHWHDAVLNECMLVESCYVESDPAQTLRNLINWYAHAEAEQQAPSFGDEIVGQQVWLTDAGELMQRDLARKEVYLDPSEQAPATERATESIGDRYAHRLAVMLECSLLDPNGTWNDAHKLLDEYRAEHERIHPSPPTYMGEPLIAANAPKPGQVDWMGLALDLEKQAKRVESQTAERAMKAGAHGLRLMGAALRSEQAPAGEVPAITAEKLLRAVYTRPDLPADARERFFAEFMRSDDDELTLNWGDFRIMAATARALSTPPAVPNYVPLSRDDARLALWQAIESINIGNKTDDKLILAELCKRSIYLCSAASAAPQGEQK